MGKELDRMSKGKRFRIVILPGKLRPIGRQLSSMYATACSIAVNEVVPLLTHITNCTRRGMTYIEPTLATLVYVLYLFLLVINSSF